MTNEKAIALIQNKIQDKDELFTYGIYEQVINEAVKSLINRAERKGFVASEEDLDADGSEEYLSRYMQKVLIKGLTEVKEEAKKKYTKLEKQEKENAILSDQINACNDIISYLHHVTKSQDILDLKIGSDKKRLLSIWKDQDLCRPRSSISVSRLFTGGSSSGFQLADELNKEIRSSNKVDFIVSFIKNSGINVIRTAIEDFTKLGGKLRILTTTYMGATEPNIVETLAKMENVEIKISYNSLSTRLHAKAYIFDRDNGFSTAYIGSSNLSRAAVTDGMEWNVKITNQDSPQIISEIKSTFEMYWNSKDFETYNQGIDYDKLCKAVGRERNRSVPPNEMTLFDIFPHPYQEELLEELKAQREIHNNYRNLIVAATGTGKTVVSAFDYLNFVKDHKGEPNRLLFIAHRKEILQQSLNKYRAVLKDANFGQLSVNGEEPSNLDHLFISIQTFNARSLERLDPNYYDFIVVDEVHHGCAESYQTLLTHFTPKILLGMTATPDRMDGLDIKQFFNGKISCEIRLPEAINRELLVPFQYYAITDPVDISSVKYERGKFDVQELNNVYINNDARISTIIRALEKYQPDLDNIKCVGFCVSQLHAEYMAKSFQKNGYKAVAITSKTDMDIREQSENQFSKGDIQFIFTVDLFNEGIDIPEINTELFLRPTESKTVFIQQLGRGLRKSKDKTELIVLDFVGQYNKNYTIYEQKLRALTSNSFLSIKDQIENGFTGLPLGCYIELETVAKQYILKNLGQGTDNKRNIVQKIREYYSNRGSIPSIYDFCKYYNLNPRSIYKTKNTLTSLCKECGLTDAEINEGELTPSAFSRISNINSRRWINSIIQMLKGTIDRNDPKSILYANMFYFTLKQSSLEPRYKSLWDFIDTIAKNTTLSNELLGLLNYNLEKIDFVDEEIDLGYLHTLNIYCSYTKDQILAATGKSSAKKPYPWREGVLYIAEKNTDIFLITLNKTEKDYSPTTMYDDYPISESLFHWQSQSGTTPDKGDGFRYGHPTEMQKTLLFVREKKEDQYGTLPYVFLGNAKFQSSEGSKPMNIVWKMDKNIPARVLSWSKLFKG